MTGQGWGEAGGEPFVGMQVGAISFVDEGVAPVLDTLRARARVNALLLSCVSWSRGNAGRSTTGFPDHGVSEPDELEGGAFFEIDPRYYTQSPIKQFHAPEPEYAGFDVLREVAPAAKARGMQVYPYYCETSSSGHRPHSIAGFPHMLEIDCWGRKGGRACVNHPGYRAWWYSIIEDWVRNHAIDGIVWGIERQGPLRNALAGEAPACFCTHCRRLAHERNVDAEAAITGYRALHTYLEAARRGERPRDGYFVEYTRILFNHPAIAAWEKLWVDSHSAMHREIYGLVKWLNPSLRCGMHVWQVTNTYSLLLKAQYPYADMVRYADFLKPVVYHTPAGARFQRIVANLHQTILRDMTPRESLPFLYKVLGLDEEPDFERLPRAGFSAEYVRREVARAVEGVANAIPVYAGVNVGVEQNPNAKPLDPAEVKDAIRAAHAGGAAGVTLSRNYSETRLANLSAVGEVLAELGPWNIPTTSAQTPARPTRDTGF